MDNDLSLLAICETWLTADVPTSYVDLPGFKFFRFDVESPVHKHGVGLYLKLGLDAVEVSVGLPNVLVVNILSWNAYVIVVYRPPSFGTSENVALRQFLVDFCVGKDVIVVGDFNLPDLRWNETGELSDGYVRPLDRSFYEVFLESGLTQLVSDPTYVSGNILDLILVSNTEVVGNLEVLSPLPRCKHSPVVVEIFLDACCSDQPEAVRAKRLWSKGNYVEMCRELETICWESLFEGLSAQDCYTKFMDVYIDLVDRFVPQRQFSETPKWSNRPPRALMIRRKNAWQAFKQTRSEYGRSHQLSLEAWEAYSEINLEYRNFTYNKRWEHELSLARNLNVSPKMFHAYIRRMKKGNPPVGPLRIDNTIVSDPGEMSEVFADYFGSIYNSAVSEARSQHQRTIARMNPLNITYDNVYSALCKLNVSSTPGGDGVHPQVLRSCAGLLAYPLTLLFERSLRSSDIPSPWKWSVVVPLFKSGSRSSPTNYRPVSLTSVCCKTMERVVAEKIWDYLEDNNLLSSRQFGFRSSRGTVEQLLLVYCDVAKWVDDGKVVDIAYLDFSKAFDLVCHEVLLEKLVALGFDSCLISWVRGFLQGRLMSVSVGGKLSQEVEVSSGVPQGSVLGPLLFLIYVNFITSNVIGSWAAFADDFKLSVCYPRNNLDDREEGMRKLQQDLNHVAETSRCWNLKLNPAKCMVMRFGERVDGNCEKYQIFGESLQFVKVYKDLGVYVDVKLRFHEHVNLVVGRASSMISNLLRCTVCRSTEFMVSLWVSHIRPLIEYGSCVWNVKYLCDARRLESLQRRWTREIHGLSGMEYVDRLRSTGLFSIHGRLLRIDLVMVWKSFHSDVDLGLESLFEVARDVGTRGHRFKLAIPVCRSEVRRRSFTVRVVSVWNSLPSRVVEADSVECFKRRLDGVLDSRLLTTI